MSLKRIQADIRELQQSLYQETGIFYEPNEQDITHGQACIFGPPGTPYEDCPMLYSFQFPADYPFDSPNVTFQTTNGHTRFHPNMYVQGNVCLSILGTWQGPAWSSILRISSVLITLQSLLTNNPIVHEPGYERASDHVSSKYSRVVELACMRYILNCAEATRPSSSIQPFFAEFQRRLPATLDRLFVRLESYCTTGECMITNVPYQMDCTTNYRELLEQVVKLKTRIAEEDK
jgi:ubiquitin-conjugating enzyme E2 Z